MSETPDPDETPASIVESPSPSEDPSSGSPTAPSILGPRVRRVRFGTPIVAPASRLSPSLSYAAVLEPLDPQSEHRRKSSLLTGARRHQPLPGASALRFSAVLTTLHSLFGISVLGLPRAISHCGIVVSVLVVTVAAALRHVSSIISIGIAERHDVESFDAITSAVFGRRGAVAVMAATLALHVMILAAYLVFAGGTVSGWLGFASAPFWHRLLCVACCSVAPVALAAADVPLVVLLARMAMFGVVGFVLIGLAVESPSFGRPDVSLGRLDSRFFTAVSVCAGYFSAPIVIVREDRHSARATIAVLLFVALGLAAGILGYVIFGDAVCGNVLDGFEKAGTLIQVVRAGVVIAALSAYPGVARASMGIAGRLLLGADAQTTGTKVVLAAAVNGAAIAVASTMVEVGPALAIVGALGGCGLGCFAPAAMWVMDPTRGASPMRGVMAGLMAAFGLGAAVAAVCRAILDIIDAFN